MMGCRLSEEELEVRQRLAALEAADPSQNRPPKVPCIWDVVDFMAWDTWRDLGLLPPAGECY
jgi:hypothetical protein